MSNHDPVYPKKSLSESTSLESFHFGCLPPTVMIMLGTILSLMLVCLPSTVSAFTFGLRDPTKYHSFRAGRTTPARRIKTECFAVEEGSGETGEFSVLSLADIYPGKDIGEIVSLVSSAESLNDFRSVLETLSKSLADDDRSLVGIDCEWKPDTLVQSGDIQKVMTLQICVFSVEKVFILDMDAVANDPETASILSETLDLLWGSPKFLKVGYQHQQDFVRLAASYPQLDALLRVEGTLDIKPVARKAIQVSGMKQGRLVEESLNRMSKKFLERVIDKEQQMSDWSQRPFTGAQLEYAALDASVTVLLLDKLMEFGNLDFYPNLGRKKKDKAYGKLITSHEFTLLDSQDPSPGERGKLRTCLGQTVHHQEWVTGTK